MRDGKRRSHARHAALALERLDQRRFLAADVGPAAEVDLDVEVEARHAGDVAPEQAVTTAVLEVGTQRCQQVLVLAAQIEEAARGPDREGGDGHAVDGEVGVAGKQHAVLKRPWLALVRVADDDPLGARGVAARLPLDRSREAGTAAAAQVRLLHLAEHRRGAAAHGRAHRIAGADRGAKQDVAPPDVVLDREELRRPVVKRHFAADQLADAVDAFDRQSGQRTAIDERCRPLVAHAGAGRGIDADQAILGGLAALEPELVAQPLAQIDAAEHAVGDVVREQESISAGRGGVQEGIEAGDALHMGPREFQFPGDRRQRLGNQIAKCALRLAQDLHQRDRIPPVGCEDRRQHGLQVSFLESHDASERALIARQTTGQTLTGSDLDQTRCNKGKRGRDLLSQHGLTALK